MAGSFEHRAGNAGVRPATRTAELPAYKTGQAETAGRENPDGIGRCLSGPSCGAQPAAGAGENSRPTPRERFLAGGRGGRGARGARYVHTHLATSSHLVFRGDSRTGARLQRNALRKKVLEQSVNSLNECGEEAEAKRLSCCGSWFKVGRCPEGGQRLEPNPCNSKLCVACADRKSHSLQKRILERCRKRGKRYYFLTLTVPNCRSLSRADLDRLIECFARLRRSTAWNRVRWSGTEWLGITGGVYSIECVFNRDRDDWHPHIHVLVEMPGENPEGWLDALKAAWLAVTGDGRNVHIERVYGRSKRGKKTYRRVNLKALKELVKYVTKAASFADSPARVGEFVRAFRDVRRVQAFGSFFGVFKDPEREVGVDGPELKCSCGSSHYHSNFTWSRRPVHISETKAMPDGTRQLKWDFWVDPRDTVEESPPDFELMRQVVESYKQYRIGFPGALPGVSEERPSLFAA
jgi:hypothetical protein